MAQAEHNRMEMANAEQAEEIARLKSELSQEHDRHLRTLADFENYRRRVERERASAAERGKRELLLSLLDLADDFERALAHVNDSPGSVVAGLQALQRRLAGLLSTYGVMPFESVGQPFDPALHEAIATVQSDEHEAGSVFDEVGRGYHWGGEVLRPARVRVVQENG
jgi:molecular chaperone GrpE